MGVHDFICFVQRNGQCLYELQLLPEPIPRRADESNEDQSDDEFDGCGSGSAAIVFVPTSFSVREILSWPLSRFREFTMREVGYSWDSYRFEDYQGYEDVLTGEKWWEQSIWESTSAPGFRLVNFEKGAYQAFVLGNVRADQIPKNYLKEVFGNRNSDVPSTKEEALAKILEAGPENLWSYDQLPVPFPTEATLLYEEVLETPFFNRSYTYSTSLPPEVGNIRYMTLISDEIKKLDLGYHVTTQMINNQIILKFSPPFYYLPTDCPFCKKRQWPGLETCLDHRDQEITTRKDELESYMSRLTKMKGLRPPELFAVTFREKGVQYNPILTLTH